MYEQKKNRKEKLVHVNPVLMRKLQAGCVSAHRAHKYRKRALNKQTNPPIEYGYTVSYIFRELAFTSIAYPESRNEQNSDLSAVARLLGRYRRRAGRANPA
jgi:hypothetical protein